MKALYNIAKVKKESIKTKECYKEMIEEVQQAADRWLQEPLPVLQYTKFCRYEQDGNRVDYEAQYFDRRGRLFAYTFCYWLEGSKKYKDALEDVLSAICEEFTWALPAHLPRRKDRLRTEDTLKEQTGSDTFSFDIGEAKAVYEDHCHLDLFAAETGSALCEVLVLVGDQLTQNLRNRICYEVRSRIIDSFLTVFTNNGWEHSKSNWAAVCGGGVGHCFFYLGTEEETKEALPRLLHAMDSYLESLPEDGACLEGSGYWTYGFGYFLYFAESLKEYSKGTMDLLSSSHVMEIAKFPQRILLGQDRSLTFSDAAEERYGYELGIAHFLHARFDAIELPDMANRLPFGADSCYRFAALLRNFLWSDPELMGSQKVKEHSSEPNNMPQKKDSVHFFEQAEWYVSRKQRLSVAIKGGKNDEPHNHNDIGNFVLVKGNEYMLHDLGAGEYVAAYFANETRYDFLVNSSRGHSVPIINGEFQRAGQEAAAEMEAKDTGSVRIRMEKAYSVASLKVLSRECQVTEQEVRITDTFDFSENPVSVTERFITKHEPVLEADRVKIRTNTGNNVDEELILFFPYETWEVKISKENYKGHKAESCTAYLIDFMPKDLIRCLLQKDKEFRLEFTLTMR